MKSFQTEDARGAAYLNDRGLQALVRIEGMLEHSVKLGLEVKRVLDLYKRLFQCLCLCANAGLPFALLIRVG
jgi:hypothetical protein